MNNLTKTHNGYEFHVGRQTSSFSSGNEIYTLEELAEFNDKEMIFTTTLKVNINNKKGRKIVRNMLEKQTSPIKSVLQSVNSDDRAEMREGAPDKYTVPDSILDEIKKDGEVKEFERY